TIKVESFDIVLYSPNREEYISLTDVRKILSLIHFSLLSFWNNLPFNSDSSCSAFSTGLFCANSSWQAMVTVIATKSVSRFFLIMLFQ
ncbi:MAG: hypothetical protein M1445_08435, partial [Bacteroidetes bacterium]|nr:hypothetical protein [Bacteroidota bacterium]